jgi:anti-sigma factor RsiW
MGLLDAFVDGELDVGARDGILAHARECDGCARALARAEALKKMLSGLDDGVKVPLAAQAAWRGAVKAEARKRRARGFYRTFGAVAAACVVLVGVAAGMNLFGRQSEEEPAALMAKNGSDASTFAFVAADGDEKLGSVPSTPRVSEEAAMTSTVRILADDVAVAAGTVKSLADEFNGAVDDSSVAASTAYLTVSVPTGEYEAFVDALAYAGTVDASRLSDGDGDTVSVTITIQEN